MTITKFQSRAQWTDIRKKVDTSNNEKKNCLEQMFKKMIESGPIKNNCILVFLFSPEEETAHHFS